ncbi:MAG: biopolymer transporter ExbD [Bacteroidales bacterium]|nr:biopolymer transporter ExbD [Bacteroidales bacterium]
MAIKTRNKLGVSFNSSSMSDLVFLLLIFFMITSTMVAPSAIKLLLPQSSSETTTDKQSLAVSITQDGQYLVGDTPVENPGKKELSEAISNQIKGEEDITIVLRADKDATAQHIVTVIDAVNDINKNAQRHHKVILATSKAPNEEP